MTAEAQEAINATVTRVIDGDTIEVQPANGGPTIVRLLGIDAPESVAPDTPVECGSDDAAAHLTNLLAGNPSVVLTTDPSQDRVDSFGRLLAYVDAGTTDVGLAMIRAGHAGVFVFEGRPFTRLPTYEDAQTEASAAQRGVWGACGGDFHRQGAPDDTVTESRSESAERFVRRYYFLLNQRRLSVAWTKLSPALRGRIGPYSRWRSGFRRTLGTRVNSATVSLAGGRAIVRLRIRSRDRDACSGRAVRQFFRGRWVLSPRGDSWVATNLLVSKVGGGNPRLRRSDCAPARRPSRPSPPPRPEPDRPETGGRCDPNYSGCLNPNASDYDCRGGGGDRPLYTGTVTVRGDDHYDLDADGDGLGCE